MTPVSIDCRDGRNFILTLDGHTVIIPVSEPKAIARILLARNGRAVRAKIGNTANPVQDMVDAWLSSNEADVRIRRKQEQIEAAREKYGDLFDEVEI